MMDRINFRRQRRRERLYVFEVTYAHWKPNETTRWYEYGRTPLSATVKLLRRAPDMEILDCRLVYFRDWNLF